MRKNLDRLIDKVDMRELYTHIDIRKLIIEIYKKELIKNINRKRITKKIEKAAMAVIERSKTTDAEQEGAIERRNYYESFHAQIKMMREIKETGNPNLKVTLRDV